jgi:hypothetical protein
MIDIHQQTLHSICNVFAFAELLVYTVFIHNLATIPVCHVSEPPTIGLQ